MPFSQYTRIVGPQTSANFSEIDAPTPALPFEQDVDEMTAENDVLRLVASARMHRIVQGFIEPGNRHVEGGFVRQPSGRWVPSPNGKSDWFLVRFGASPSNSGAKAYCCAFAVQLQVVDTYKKARLPWCAFFLAHSATCGNRCFQNQVIALSCRHSSIKRRIATVKGRDHHHPRKQHACRRP